MNQEIKQKWVEALRSGEYKQGKGQLRDKDSFCCLGVLCDIHHKESGEGRWFAEEYESGGTSSVAILPPPVMRWAGLPDTGGVWGNPAIGGETCVYFNDTGTPFDRIADMIEADL